MKLYPVDIDAKAQMLHHGFNMTETAQSAFEFNYLTKQRFYSNYDDDYYLTIKVPPEIVFPTSGIVATAILKKDSPWTLDYTDDKFFLKNHKNSQTIPVGFSKTPLFYGKKLKNGDLVEQHITKLFGHTIGVFSSTHCYFGKKDTVCKFCSIAYNKGRPNNVCQQANISNILEAIEIAVTTDNTIDNIFISGGILSSDFDNNFIFYSDLAISIKEFLLSIGKSIEVTLNTYPPINLQLINRLKNKNIAVMISIETVDDKLRSFVCPGKSSLFNEIGIDKLFEKFVSVVGPGRVLAFLIQGLESDEAILKGVYHYAKLGVCAVVHILHVDPGTWVCKNNIQVPSPKRIINVAKRTSSIYHEHHLDSSILYGGRSSFDKEASIGLL